MTLSDKVFGSPEKVNVNWQTLFAFLPLIWIWAYGRIRKLRKALLLLVLEFAVSIALNIVLPPPYGFIISYGVMIPVIVYFIRKWSKEWNNSIGTVTNT